MSVPQRLTPYRVGTVNASIVSKVRDEPFVFNDQFVLAKSSDPDYFVDGELTFPVGIEKPDGFYKTRFGPAFEHNGVIYSKCDQNQRYGMRRLTNKREPLKTGLHELLFAQQDEFVRSRKDFLSYLHDKYAPAFDDYMGAEEEMYKHYNDPHPKRELRVKAHDEMIEEATCSNCDSTWLKDILWKVKPQEWAKFGKKPRCICDLGVSASLRGFVLTNILKMAQADIPIEALGGTFAFCKSPDPFELKRHFDLLYNPPKRFYFLYFSDDSCLSIRTESGDVQWFNLDISSCDASHGKAIFDALTNLVPEGNPRFDMRKLVQQCKAPLRVQSNCDKDLKITLKPKQPVLMSGSTLTTAINNLVNLLIAHSIVSDFVAAPVGVTNTSMVEAAARAGYILTGTVALEHFEDVQFLKNSPVLDTSGQWQPMLNLGVLYRASGTCNGDLPPTCGNKNVPFEQRAAVFQRSLLHGSYPFCSFEILKRMKSAVGEGSIVKTKEFEFKVHEDADKYPPFIVDEESIIRRYRLEEHEYQELLDFANYSIGWFYSSTGASKVLEKDYGLETIESSDTEYVVGLEDEFGHTFTL